MPTYFYSGALGIYLCRLGSEKFLAVTDDFGNFAKITYEQVYMYYLEIQVI